VVEQAQLYIRKSGEEIAEQLYTFEDKSGRQLSLRPEMTPSLARMVLAKGKALSLPIKWFSVPQCWRYEKMSRGRRRYDCCDFMSLTAGRVHMLMLVHKFLMQMLVLVLVNREHYQWNMDIWGVPGVEAEAEILSALVSSLKSMGLSAEDVGIKVFTVI
jgi:histidyl-tRNA synthetase